VYRTSVSGALHPAHGPEHAAWRDAELLMMAYTCTVVAASVCSKSEVDLKPISFGSLTEIFGG